ncbi:hypothetical protein O181_085775 [Austropuccinia psidii MF-1]|uniref:Uncharacterized protein n=1 Tax=Austropuccinia psidii MF-1 TaxID=1389203 RepID=A0A9Q3FSX2_9BASI|nr:hypothetical protein [Austropuccinia psidii MF-1]
MLERLPGAKNRQEPTEILSKGRLHKLRLRERTPSSQLDSTSKGRFPYAGSHWQSISKLYCLIPSTLKWSRPPVSQTSSSAPSQLVDT